MPKKPRGWRKVAGKVARAGASKAGAKMGERGLGSGRCEASGAGSGDSVYWRAGIVVD